MNKVDILVLILLIIAIIILVITIICRMKVNKISKEIEDTKVSE